MATRRPIMLQPEYGTAPMVPMAAPTGNGLDTGSATQRKPLPYDEEGGDPDTGVPDLAELMRLMDVLKTNREDR
jgi:hypothetical protein